MVVYAAPRFDGAAHAVVRWLGGVALVHGLAIAVAEWLRSIYLLVGVAVPPIHRSPLASRSLREFWGDRWNRIVGGWLREAIFLPLARRRRTTEGSTLAFVASALLHGYAATAAIGAAKAAPMIAFFLLQGALVLVERALRVERWPDAWARIWFFSAMLCTLPLFLQPVLAILLPATS
jgi:D-alanyl-lipoteichoic acid acyltransferase DltB (MBOAT superfamily)